VRSFLNRRQRGIVENAIRAVCRIREYSLGAINVRTNHAHVVVTVGVKPESIINGFKANATRELREAKLIGTETRVWSRGGSRRYLWKARSFEAAIDYVINGQGDELPNF